MSFSSRVAKHFILRKAAREIGKEIKKAGLDDLQRLANARISIVGTYLEGCSASEKAKHRRELSAVRSVGVTPDMILEELILQMPELADIIGGRQDYKRKELQNLEAFLKGG